MRAAQRRHPRGSTTVAYRTVDAAGTPLIPHEVLNAVLVLVVLTSIGGPLLTQRFARKLAPEAAAPAGEVAAPAGEVAAAAAEPAAPPVAVMEAAPGSPPPAA